MITVKVEDIEGIKRNSSEFKRFLNSNSVSKLLEAVGNDLKPYLEKTTGDSFSVKIKPSKEPRSAVEVYSDNFSRGNFYNASIPTAVINFINDIGGIVR